MHDAVEPVVAVVDGGECPADLAEVGQVDAGERDAWIRTGHPIEIEHLVAMLEQLRHDRPPELAASAGYRDPHRRLLSDCQAHITMDHSWRSLRS